jgi:type IV pilus assembly protein PilA
MSRSRLRADTGYTLVELLVALLILGILVAVGLASFVGQRTKAQDTHAKTAAVTASKALLAYGTDHGSFDGVTRSDLLRIEPSLELARNLTVTGEGRTYKVTIDSPASTGATFSIERTADGDTVRDCTPPGAGACRAAADDRGNRW